MIYTYSISNDTLNGQVAMISLQKEVANALPASVFYITTQEDDLHINFAVALDAGQKTTLDSTISIHTGRELSYVDSSGLPVTAPTFEWDGNRNGKWEGQLYTATAGVENFFDIAVPATCELRGGWYQLLESPAKAVINDYIEFSVIDKDDVLGLFSTYGLTVGEDVLELNKFLKKGYVNPNSTSGEEYIVRGSSTILQGLYLRVGYKSTGLEDVKFKIVLHTYEG